jgi:hypothetical protein
VEHLKGASAELVSALLARSGFKGLPGQNTYYEHYQITVVKRFITLGPGSLPMHYINVVGIITAIPPLRT